MNPTTRTPTKNGSGRVATIERRGWLDAVMLWACVAYYTFMSYLDLEVSTEAKTILAVVAGAASVRWAALRRNGKDLANNLNL